MTMVKVLFTFRHFHLGLILLFLSCSYSDQIRASVSESICREYMGIASKSPLLKLCRNKPSLFDQAQKGFNKGVQECRDAFRAQRWNCTTEEGKERYKLFGTPMSRSKCVLFSKTLGETLGTLKNRIISPSTTIKV